MKLAFAKDDQEINWPCLATVTTAEGCGGDDQSLVGVQDAEPQLNFILSISENATLVCV